VDGPGFATASGGVPHTIILYYSCGETRISPIISERFSI